MGLFKRRNKFDSETISLTAMIDIMFLLLIYLVLTHKPLLEDAFLGANLPAPDVSTKPSKPVQLFTVDIKHVPYSHNESTYSINGTPWNFEELVSTLQELGKETPDTSVIINCDPNIRHNKLIAVLDACSKAGLSNLNIITDESIPFTPDKPVTK